MPVAVEQQAAQDQTKDLDTMFVKAGEASAAQAATAADASTQQAAAASGAGEIRQAAQPAPQVTTAEITDAMAAAKELGVDITRFKSPAELVRAMYGRIKDSDQYAQLGQRYAPHAREFDEWLAQRGQQAAAAAKSATVERQAPEQAEEWNEDEIWKKAWNPPQYKPQWDRAIQAGAVEAGENGLIKAASPEFAGMAQEINDYLIAKREWDATQRSVNPHKSQWEAQKPVLERHVKQMLDARIKEAFEEYQFNQEIGQWESWLDQYSYDADPITGRRTVNEWRQKFDSTLDYLKQRHPADHYRTLLEDALAIVGQPQAGQAQAAATTATAQQQPTVAQVSAQKKDDFLRGAQALQPGERNTAIAPSAITDQPPGSEAELATMFLEAGRQLEARPR